MKEYRYVNKLSKKNRVVRLIWGFVWFLFFRTTPRWALHGWRRMVLRAFGARVGRGCRIDPSVRIWLPSNLEFGDYVAIGEGANLYCVASITIGSKVAISQRAFLCTASHDVTCLTRPLISEPICIDDHVWVAAEAMIFPGTQIGKGAVIAARAVIRKRALPWTIYAGNPAQNVGERILDSTAIHMID